MTNEDETNSNAGLVRSQAATLSRVGTTSLASRTMKDLRVREDAEQEYIRGLNLRDQEEQEQEYTCAGLLCEGEEDLELMDLEGYKEAFACFQRGIALNPNHVGLQFCLGLAYCNGEGVPRNFGAAVSWWRNAARQGFALARAELYRLAEQGHAGAAFELGSLYEIGQGVMQSYIHAAAWYRFAAEHGDERAQQVLDDKAAAWYRKAAEQGDEDARKILDDILRKDEVTQDEEADRR